MSSNPTPLRSRKGLTLLSTVTLAAIVSLLVLVSLSRLRGFVVRENEQDALGAVRLVAGLLAAPPDGEAPAAGPVIRTLIQDGELARRLPDATFHEAGRVMQSHGYFFEILELPRAAAPGGLGILASLERSVQAAPPRSTLAVRAWPCVPGETGTAILVAMGPRTVLGHPNENCAWGGLLTPPPLPATAEAWVTDGWRPLRN